MAPPARDLVESDFDTCFTGQPAGPPVADDLARGRARRHRRWGTAGLVGGVALVVAVALAVLPGVGQLDAVPARTGAPATPTASTPSSTPSDPTPSDPTTVAPPVPKDTAPPLTYTKAKGYRDRDGHTLDAVRANPFEATTKHTYNLVRAHLDPRKRHLDAYEPFAFTGGGGSDSIEVGQKLGWSITGQPGQGVVLVAVTRMAPGVEPRTKGDERNGLCAGSFTDAPPCRATTISDREVFVSHLPGGGYIVDYVQPDGEIAGAWVDPLFANNTSTPVKKMDVPIGDVVDLLADPDLDVIG